jgi:hypothetical protein
MVLVSERFLKVIYIVGYLPCSETPPAPRTYRILALALVRYCIRLGLTMSRDAFPFFFVQRIIDAPRNPLGYPTRGSQMSSVTPSQSASQILLPGSDSTRLTRPSSGV